VSHKKEVGRTPQAFANLPKGAHTKINAWSLRLGLGMRLITSSRKNNNAERPKKLK